ncbi:hypothetical protein AG1IA_06022 [Rhizoctonia solani AG-1 IA]|uniref:Uncharacterized protein n=1 Tax=Thanatephorus cucumeris (strain AG1-IA) TaxID=983506 RepID=L8WUC2_THACA|nr:hypothetical protein AG1IA_06022 [Rhizoctonia solani AG-1 IA]
MMSALVRHHFSTIVNATQSLRAHPLPVQPILRQPPTWAGFGSAFAGLRTGIGREVGHGARQASQSAQRSRIVSLGTPSLLFHDRRAPRPHQISRSGPIALQVHAALFHASRPNQGLPFIWLATVLKVYIHGPRICSNRRPNHHVLAPRHLPQAQVCLPVPTQSSRRPPTLCPKARKDSENPVEALGGCGRPGRCPPESFCERNLG